MKRWHLVDAGQAPNWVAPQTLQVKFVNGRTNATNTAFGCVYELRLWGELYDRFSDVKNVELFTSDDVLSLSAAIKDEFPEAQLTIFDWKDGLRATIADSEVLYSRYHGGFLLYIKK